MKKRADSQTRTPHIGSIGSEDALLRLAAALGAEAYGGPLSRTEKARIRAAISRAPTPTEADIRAAKAAIVTGGDPLGERLSTIRSASERRRAGQVFTPRAIAQPMVDWLLAQNPSRVVDPGCGSGRFTLAVAREADIPVLAIDIDPVSTIVTRAGLAALGGIDRVRVRNADYLRTRLPRLDGRTAFIGNPPYVRHHDLDENVKAWGQGAAERLGISLSGLAGLHAYFFLATALHAQPGDVGCFVTSSEWLDVNYGSAIRDMLLEVLGGQSIHVVDAEAEPFKDTATTAVLTCFAVASRADAIGVRQVAQSNELAPLRPDRTISRESFARSSRWTQLVRRRPSSPKGYVELGEICRVHRGQVTGANASWVLPPDAASPVPDRYVWPAVTKARDLLDAGNRIETPTGLRRVIDLPRDLGDLADDERAAVEEFLDSLRRQGVADGYVARNRKAWWSVGLLEPAPLLATYMARRPPAFVRNEAGVRHINIAHGIYPREPLPDLALDRLASALRRTATLERGRTYAGGLVKFEPREMERLPVPSLDVLLEDVPGASRATNMGRG